MTAARLRSLFTLGLFILGLGLVLFALLTDPLNLGRTPSFGAVQMFLFLLGLTFLTIAVYLYLQAKRPADIRQSLQASIGVRLSATGLVLAYVSGFSDLIGIGTHVQPEFARPYVGPLQFAGLGIGVLAIVIGMILYVTSRGRRETSSLEFILPNSKQP